MNLSFINYFFFLQNQKQKAAPDYLKMVSLPMACTPSIQMAVKPIPVLCEMTTDGGGWTVSQRRLDGSVDFFRDWKPYKEGFGSLSGEFWLGNDNLHRLTNANDVMLRVDLEDFEGNITYVEYKTFKVADEADKYKLTLGEYSGIPSCIIRIVNSQEIHWCWMCCILSLFWAESMINQKRFLNSVSSSFLIFFK